MHFHVTIKNVWHFDAKGMFPTAVEERRWRRRIERDIEQGKLRLKPMPMVFLESTDEAEDVRP